MANREKLSRPVAILCATVVNAGRAGMLNNMVHVLLIPMLHAIGRPMAIRIRNVNIRMNISTMIGLNSFFATA
jgi:hypothetical protein